MEVALDTPLRSLVALQTATLGSYAPEWGDEAWTRRLALAGKRGLDVIVASALLLLLVPLLTACAVSVRLCSPGSVLFSHRRIGRGGRMFGMWKFRSMYPDAKEILDRHLRACPNARREWAATQKLRQDPRVTPVGWFLRRFSLDELPQLWNVIAGEMSLVGPRPIVESEIAKYGDRFVSYASVRPGLTGLWQVSGRSRTTYERRVDLDDRYVRTWSLAMDLSILIRTFRTVITGDGAY